MKLSTQPLLPLYSGSDRFMKELLFKLTGLFSGIAEQVNLLSEGKLSAHYTAATAAPTTGSYSQGDLIWNSEPTELGSAPNKYVIQGWRCTAAGTPGTWLEMRTLTGN